MAAASAASPGDELRRDLDEEAATATAMSRHVIAGRNRPLREV